MNSATMLRSLALALTLAVLSSVPASAAAEKIMAVFKNAATEGFHPDDYLTPAIDISGAGTDPQKLVAVETAFSAATIRYAHDAYLGRIAPEAAGRGQARAAFGG